MNRQQFAMSDRVRQSVGTICICCNLNDRGVKTMSDPDWLEIVGHPTIPHVQSLRAPPAQVALQPSKEKLIGLTNRNVSKRYLEKLQKEREKNKEVLAECVDKLPIVIKPVVYPEKPSAQMPWRTGTGNLSLPSREKKFRISKNHGDDPWHETWAKQEHGDLEQSEAHGKSQGKSNLGSSKRHRQPSSFSSSYSDPAVLNNEYVHHGGFHGSHGNQVTNLKYKFDKKKAKLSPETASSHTQSTFRPKGYGSLYDEMEFERRYKKVFDLNKHIHFVHSNFLSGQRIIKRTKLPPIGHVPAMSGDSLEGRDIFAIMSVQKYNHPDDTIDIRQSLDREPVTRRDSSRSSSSRHRGHLEIPQEIVIPQSFIPGSIKSTGNSPFDGVKGLTPETLSKEPNFHLPTLHGENDSALGTLTEETNVRDAVSQQSFETPVSKGTMHTTHKKPHREKVKQPKIENENTCNRDSRASFIEDSEPFNISVQVNIKPKETEVQSYANAQSGYKNSYEHDRDKLSNSPLYGVRCGGPSRSSGRQDAHAQSHGSAPVQSFGIITHVPNHSERFTVQDSVVEESEDEEDVRAYFK